MTGALAVTATLIFAAGLVAAIRSTLPARPRPVADAFVVPHLGPRVPRTPVSRLAHMAVACALGSIGVATMLVSFQGWGA